MILNYKVNNFKSFEDEANFSMKPGKSMPRFEDNVINKDNSLKISKFAVIAGENAGGKTSFMTSLDFLKYCILFANNIRCLKSLVHKNNIDKEQKFELSILADNNKIYTYNLELDKYFIVKESLYIRNYNQKEDKKQRIFEISRNDINIENNRMNLGLHMSEKYIPEEMKPIIENQIKDKDTTSGFTGSFVNFFYKLNIEIIKPFIDWITNKLIIEVPSDASLNIYKKMEENLNDIKIMNSDSFFEIFRLVDSSITSINIDEEEPYLDTIIERKLENGDVFKIKLGSESSGIKEFFAWAVQIWKVLYQDAILLADEVDRVLNPVLSSKIVSYLRGSEHKGQFIFTTHNVINLNTNDFMKEQIYFITKDPETLSSELYSLKEFKDYRYEKSNVYELYLKGILGGIPNG